MNVWHFCISRYTAILCTLDIQALNWFVLRSRNGIPINCLSSVEWLSSRMQRSIMIMTLFIIHKRILYFQKLISAIFQSESQISGGAVSRISSNGVGLFFSLLSPVLRLPGELHIHFGNFFQRSNTYLHRAKISVFVGTELRFERCWRKKKNHYRLSYVSNGVCVCVCVLCWVPLRFIFSTDPENEMNECRSYKSV